MRIEHTGGGEQESAAQSPGARAAGQPPPSLAPSPQIHISALQNRTVLPPPGCHPLPLPYLQRAALLLWCVQYCYMFMDKYVSFTLTERS